MIIFCDMATENTPTGDLMVGLKGSFDQWEKALIRERTMAGREKMARAGVQTARLRSPFGYHIVGNSDVIRGDYPANMLGQYVVIEAEAQIVRALFTRYIAGASQNALARWMNEQGVPTNGGGAYWGHTTIAYILRNPVYKGVAAFGKNDYQADETCRQQRDPYTGRLLKTARTCTPANPSTWITWPVPAVISEDLWDAARARAPKNKGGKPALRVRLLAGRIFCPECEAGIVCASWGTHRGDGSTHYACGRSLRQSRSTGASSCVANHYPISFVESAVIEAIADALRRPEIIAKALEVARRVYAEDLPEEEEAAEGGALELSRLEVALADLEKKQAATVEAQIAGIMAGLAPPPTVPPSPRSPNSTRHWCYDGLHWCEGLEPSPAFHGPSQKPYLPPPTIPGC